MSGSVRPADAGVRFLRSRGGANFRVGTAEDFRMPFGYNRRDAAVGAAWTVGVFVAVFIAWTYFVSWIGAQS